MTTFVGIDFEFANATHGSLCAYGLAFEDGTVEQEVLALHPTAGEQERTAYHSITPEATAAGAPFASLYARLQQLPEDAVLVAHDSRIDRRELAAAFVLWGLPHLSFTWLDSLSVAKRILGSHAKTGIATLAEKFELTVTAHAPGDDALVALQVIKTYGHRGVQTVKL